MAQEEVNELPDLVHLRHGGRVHDTRVADGNPPGSCPPVTTGQRADEGPAPELAYPQGRGNGARLLGRAIERGRKIGGVDVVEHECCHVDNLEGRVVRAERLIGQRQIGSDRRRQRAIASLEREHAYDSDYVWRRDVELVDEPRDLCQGVGPPAIRRQSMVLIFSRTRVIDVAPTPVPETPP